MGLPRPIADARPNARRKYAGALNESVGGSVRFFDIPNLLDQGGRAVAVDSREIRERGVTIPVTVTAASQEIFPSDSDRKFLVIINNDPLGVVYVTFGGIQAALLQGLRCAPNGGGYLLDINVPTAKIHMIGTIANNPNVSVILG